MSRCRRLTRLAVAASCSAALVTGSASAQVAANPDYYLKGSDTWFEVMTDAIAEAKAQGVIPTTSPTLVYDGTGSGNAANQMKAVGGGGVNLGVQSIGPMSRNFRPAEVAQFPTWAPALENVGGLDAAVIVRSDLASCVNRNLPLLPTDATKANPNTATLPWNGFVSNTGYDQVLEVILAGIDGSGSVRACADPRRTQAILDFAACNGVANINHFYRRDDNSGTTDTFKDKVAVSRFCNGAAVGQNTARADGQFNLNNQDHDPIRRPCDVSSPTRTRTTCTNLATGTLCDSADPSCTQGLIVALSIGDPGFADVTLTIGNRVRSDPTGQTFGYAGREAARIAGGGAQAVFINTNPPSDTLVRGDNYMLARRLFLMRGPAVPALDAIAFVAGAPPPTVNAAGQRLCNGVLTASGVCNERVNDLASSALTCPATSSNTCQGGGTTQRNLEDALFQWMTSPDNTLGLGLPGRCNVDPIMRRWGYLSCTDSCIDPPSGPENLCSKSPYPPVPSTPSACVPTTTPNVAGSNLWAYGQVACTGTTICCSNGLACNAQPAGTPAGSCAAATGRPVNVACSQDGVQAECATGLTCTDVGAGTLICQ